MSFHQGCDVTVTGGRVLTVTWEGAGADRVRMRLVINEGAPTTQELAIKRGGGASSLIGSNLAPEFDVTTGRRRLDNEAYPR